MQSSDKSSLWSIHANLKRRKSSNGINLVFVPGQNVVLELNEVAGDIMEAFSDGPISFDALCSGLFDQYQIEDKSEFNDEINQVLERFTKHGLIVPCDEGVGDDASNIIR